MQNFHDLVPSPLGSWLEAPPPASSWVPLASGASSFSSTFLLMAGRSSPSFGTPKTLKPVIHVPRPSRPGSWLDEPLSSIFYGMGRKDPGVEMGGFGAWGNKKRDRRGGGWLEEGSYSFIAL